MKLVYKEEMALLDKTAEKKYGIPSLVLMENAGRAVFETAAEMLGGDIAGKEVVIFAGKGNNGGDGLVAARWLERMDAKVIVFLAAPIKEYAGDALKELKICRKAEMEIEELSGEFDLGILSQYIADADLVIDALLGTGFSGELKGSYKTLCRFINVHAKQVLAVDIPTGVNSNTGEVDDDAVCATVTVTMELLKPGLILYPGKEMCGKVAVAPIGVPSTVEDEIESRKYLLTDRMAKLLLPIREGNCHKGKAGRVCVVAGSPGYVGAAELCANAAVKAGAGLVSLYTPMSSQDVLAIKMTEVMVKGLPESTRGCLGEEAVAEVLQNSTNSVLAIGPGLGTSEATQEAVRQILKAYTGTVVIDADALTAFAGHTEMLSELPCAKILTPHPGELARLLGMDADTVDKQRLSLAGVLARKWKCMLVLKGAPTVVGLPNGVVYVNTTGNEAMATGGSGDVLTGTIAALAAAQGVSKQEAALVGVYLHGLAGDMLAEENGIGFAASEISAMFPKARKALAECEI